MSESFYPFVDSGDQISNNQHIINAQDQTFNAHINVDNKNEQVRVKYPARIAVYDDLLSTPRVIIVEPKDIRSYLEEITNTCNKLVKELGGEIPFMVIREIVENFIHAYFIEPTVSILDGGNTIRFADQGPGITNKKLALEAGMTSANETMKKYIRGVGSGFPTVKQYLEIIGGKLTIDDNMNGGTVVTVTMKKECSNQSQDITENTFSTKTQAINPQPWNTIYAGQTTIPSMAPTPIGTFPYPNYGYNVAQSAGFINTPMPNNQPYGGASINYMSAPNMNYQYGEKQTQQQPPYLTDRAKQAIVYMQHNGIAGPTDLMQALGSSTATWSRELGTLAEIGLVVKHGQKYILTQIGNSYIVE